MICSRSHTPRLSIALLLLTFFGYAEASRADTWTQGPKTLLFMRAAFPDDLTEPITESDAYQLMSQVNQWYIEISYNTVSISAQVTPLLILPQTKSWYSANGVESLLEDARTAALSA